MTKRLNSENNQSNYKIKIRLPNRNEWLRAANGHHKNPVYSWGGPYLRNSKGLLLCNLNSLGAENISFDQKTPSYSIKEFASYMGVAGQLNDNADITAPVNSYFPNDFGLHNMNGNVAELVTDNLACGGSWNSVGYDVRNKSTITYEKTSSKIGFRPLMIISEK